MTSLYVDGTISVTGGTFAITGSAGGSGNYSISGGTFEPSGTVTIGGAFDWTGGTISGSGNTLTAAGGGDVGGSPTLNDLTLKIASGQTLTFHANMTAENGTVINNVGTFKLVEGGGYIAGDGTVAFDNNGSFVVTAANPMRVSAAFNNTGLGRCSRQHADNRRRLVQHQAPGALRPSRPARLYFEGTQSFTAGSISSAGTVEFDGSATVATSYSVSGSTVIGTNGDAVFSSSVGINGSQLIDNGIADFSAASFASPLSLDDVYLYGNLVVNGGLTVTGPGTITPILPLPSMSPACRRPSGSAGSAARSLAAAPLPSTPRRCWAGCPPRSIFRWSTTALRC